jgi:hypothetical protein
VCESWACCDVPAICGALWAGPGRCGPVWPGRAAFTLAAFMLHAVGCWAWSWVFSVLVSGSNYGVNGVTADGVAADACGGIVCCSRANTGHSRLWQLSHVTSLRQQFLI